MNTVPVTFRYFTSVRGEVFPAAQAFLEGSWDAAGHYSTTWTSMPMQRSSDETGCTLFEATLQLDAAGIGTMFGWGVFFLLPDRPRQWAIPTELNSPNGEQHRLFQLQKDTPEQVFFLTHCHRLGANRSRNSGGKLTMRFAAWAPNARNVQVVFGKIWDATDTSQKALNPNQSIPNGSLAGGYVADDGTGIRSDRPSLNMSRLDDGVWLSNPDDPTLPDLSALEHAPYMYRITREDGSIAYRTDLYSRCQIGFGPTKPGGAPFTDRVSMLDGLGSCSVTVDPAMVTKYFREEAPYYVTKPPSERVWPERHFIPEKEFWNGEFNGKTPPTRVDDLIIYELHMGALGYGRADTQGHPIPGTIEDVIGLLDHIAGLNFNAIELLPLSEFGGRSQNWGYATSHYFAIEYSGGGRDQFKFLVRECHRRGLAVIMDVVYNHYAHDGERAEWHYDSVLEQNNCYYWYEGTPESYVAYQTAARDASLPPAKRPALNQGGYVDNMSTSYAPRYSEEAVRKLFISSATMLMREFHVDGFRVDQTTSIHGYNALHADGTPVPQANLFGAKLLRELGRTLRLFKPGVMLMAEDHSDWDQVTMPTEQGGMGFDARWYSEFYHHLAGDTDRGADTAKLLYSAALLGAQASLKMSYFAGALSASTYQKVVYNESHDEAGNSKGPFKDPDWNPIDADKMYTSHRGLVVASNGAVLLGDTRRYAEARCRFAWGSTVLSAGTPMTLFGEEVGAVRRFKYDAVLDNREDLLALKYGSGSGLAKFYADINALRLSHSALRSRNLQVVHVHDDNRVLVFKRWDNSGSFLIFSSLNDQPFANGYTVTNPSVDAGDWREIFNSDSSKYGGMNVGNEGGLRNAQNGSIDVVIPFAGFVVFRKES